MTFINSSDLESKMFVRHRRVCQPTELDLIQLNMKSLEVRGFTFPKQDAGETQTRCYSKVNQSFIKGLAVKHLKSPFI